MGAVWAEEKFVKHLITGGSSGQVQLCPFFDVDVNACVLVWCVSGLSLLSHAQVVQKGQNEQINDDDGSGWVTTANNDMQ